MIPVGTTSSVQTDSFTKEGKRKRRSAPKVRSGCFACRARRIKCDEKRPSCLKCSSTGRTCDGYPPSFQFQVITNNPKRESKPASTGSTTSTLVPKTNPPPGTDAESDASNEISLPTTPISTFAGNPQEQQLFMSFVRDLGPGFGGLFETDFWNIQLPRVASCEPAIYHAMLANAALDREDSQVNEGGQVSFLLQYNKAIQHVKQKLQPNHASQMVILFTCLLFISIEFRRGNTDVALNHLQSGLNILHSSKASHEASEISDVNRNVSHAFYRLSIQASLVGHQPPPFQDQDMPIIRGHAAFSSIIKARDCLVIHFIEGLKPPESNFTFQSSFSNSSSEQARRATLISQLHQWNSRLGLFMTDTLSHPTPQDMRMIRLLRIQSLVAIIWNSTTIPSTDGASIEPAFDGYTEMFRTLLSLAAYFIVGSDVRTPSTSTSSTFQTPSSGSFTPSPASTSTTTTSHSRSSFSFEMGLIFALYFVAIKCRSPSLRRQATSFLFQVEPRREGMWDARVLEKVAQYVIEVEEGSCVEAVTEDATTWPREEGRVQSIYLFPRCDYGRRVQKVTLYWGLGGRVHELERDIMF